MRHMQNLAVAMGALCILYFLAIWIVAVHGTNFYFIWLVIGLFLIGWAVCMKKGVFIPQIPIWIKRGFLVMFCLGCLLFVFVEGLILSGFSAKGKEGLDYIIVLGAQMKANGPSRVLKMRLDTAYDYLVDNPDTVVIEIGRASCRERV